MYETTAIEAAVKTPPAGTAESPPRRSRQEGRCRRGKKGGDGEQGAREDGACARTLENNPVHIIKWPTSDAVYTHGEGSKWICNLEES